MNKKKKFVKLNKYKESEQEKILDAVKNKEIMAYVKDPITQIPIPVPHEIFMKIKNGEYVTLDQIKNYKYVN